VSVGLYALSDLPSLKRWLGIRPSQADQDQLLEELIDTATAIIEKKTSRRLKKRTFENDPTSISSDGSQTEVIWLLEFPVVSVAKVNLGFGSSDLASGDYAVYKDAGYIRLQRRVAFEEDRAYNVLVPAGIQNVRVDYVAGYDPVPADLRQACRDLAAHMFVGSWASDKRMGLASRSVGDKAESYIADATIPPRVEQLIEPYVRVSLISHREEEGA